MTPRLKEIPWSGGGDRKEHLENSSNNGPLGRFLDAFLGLTRTYNEGVSCAWRDSLWGALCPTAPRSTLCMCKKASGQNGCGSFFSCTTMHPRTHHNLQFVLQRVPVTKFCNIFHTHPTWPPLTFFISSNEKTIARAAFRRRH